MHDILAMEDAFRRGEAQDLLTVDVQVERLKSEGFPILVNIQEAYLPQQDRVMVATGQRSITTTTLSKAFSRA